MKAETESSSAPNPEEPSKISRIPRWVGAIAAIALIVWIIGVILFYGYQARPGWVGVANKKFWDYLELLIVPAALAIGVYLLNRAQSEREHEAEEAQQERERRAEEARRERELEVENQRAQDEALQAYLDQMSQLLTDKERPLHRSRPDDSLSIVARARTLTMLPRLDGARKARVVQFLHESGLIAVNYPINLNRGDLSGAKLGETFLIGIYLRGAVLVAADLSEATLGSANLSYADLSGAFLSGANLWHANLMGANLRDADLRDAYKLKDIDWYRQQGLLRFQSISQLLRSGRDRQPVPNEELEQQAATVEGATMPNGQKYEDWLKSKAAGRLGRTPALRNSSQNELRRRPQRVEKHHGAEQLTVGTLRASGDRGGAAVLSGAAAPPPVPTPRARVLRTPLAASRSARRR